MSSWALVLVVALLVLFAIMMLAAVRYRSPRGVSGYGAGTNSADDGGHHHGHHGGGDFGGGGGGHH